MAGPLKAPRHLAIIMDGNGRWAKKHHLPRLAGHREGINSVREAVETAGEVGIKYLTLFTFSTENWQRPRREVQALMKLLVNSISREKENLHHNQVRVNTIGNLAALPPEARAEMISARELTKNNPGLVLTLALSYGGRQELINAVEDLLQDPPPEVTAETISSRLETRELPDPDLLIRTGGERRLSNFLLWQLAYTEIYFSDIYWPDFRRPQLLAALEDFAQRERRFGRISEQIKK
jgi:undecaprenyl diphosphate synthase